MDIIYDLMIKNNLEKINNNGFNYDDKLIVEKDNRYCYAIFSIPNNKQTFFNKIFYDLQQTLSLEPNGITYYVDNNNLKYNGTFHFTFLQQLSFNSYCNLPQNITDKYYKILLKLLKPCLPFKIYYNKLIMVSNGIVLCGYASIDVNKLREEYRSICKHKGLPLIEPYYLDIIHSTLFRFTNKEHDALGFIKKYDMYLNKNIDFGYVIIDHFNIGKATWKVNHNEIVIDNRI